jgi:hypothetical protein
MDEAKQDKPKARRGRPATGTAKTSTQRSQARDEALLEAGGKIISRLRLSPEAAAALARQAERFKDERAAIEAALIAFDK